MDVSFRVKRPYFSGQQVWSGRKLWQQKKKYPVKTPCMQQGKNRSLMFDTFVSLYPIGIIKIRKCKQYPFFFLFMHYFISHDDVMLR